jgi:V8-like Glu-specific endopeptidase
LFDGGEHCRSEPQLSASRHWGGSRRTPRSAKVTENGRVATFTESSSTVASGVDIANAKPRPMPLSRLPAISQSAAIRNAPDPLTLFGNPEVSPGWIGTGEENPIQLPPAQTFKQKNAIVPEEFGTANLPYSTSRVNATGNLTVKFYPFRAAGKLFFNVEGQPFICSGSLIEPGIVVTAGHCVANYGKKQFYSKWLFVPAYDNGSAPYGKWSVTKARVLNAYFNGTDNCAQFGVVCPDDVATLTLTAQRGAFAGTATGWFGLGKNGYGFNSKGQVLINQLGYPGDLDKGALMERNDAQGSITAASSNNTIIGSLMTAGSSGGPWLVNLGIPPTLSGGDSFGTDASHNVVVGVTSWGSNNNAVKNQGAAPFTSNNIQVLVNAACAAAPAACQ